MLKQVTFQLLRINACTFIKHCDWMSKNSIIGDKFHKEIHNVIISLNFFEKEPPTLIIENSTKEFSLEMFFTIHD